MKIILIVLGLIALLKGGYIVVFPDQTCRILDFYKAHLRALGISVIVAGAACIAVSLFL